MSDVIKIESYDLARADESARLATELASFIKDNGLSTKIQGKDFVNAEGWQYAGSRLGIVPMVEYVTDMSTPDEIKYECKVTLYDLRREKTVGVGVARCSNKESGKKFFADYAIASMCQTRAIGKAYRNLLAWIIKAAGFSPTPADEMVTLQDACFEALTAPDLLSLGEIAKKYKHDFGANDTFKLAGKARKADLEALQS